MATRKRMAVRSIVVIGGGFTLLFFLLFARLFWIQYVAADWLNAAASSQWEREEFVYPKRGAILDRKGQNLAYNGPSYNIVAVLSKKAPDYVIDPIGTARQLAPILNMSAERLIELMSRGDRYQVELRPGGWKISEDKKKQIEQLDLPGILWVQNTNRYYPNNSFAAHTIGYVDKEGNPIMGLELVYDDVLRGSEGKYRFIKDNKNKVMPQGIEDFEPAVDGNDVVLTIDQRIQHFVEQALDAATQSYDAKSIITIVADPNTMEILALDNRPNFNPNEYSLADVANFTNLAISSPYEPGSTMKILTLAAAIEEGIWNPEETFQSGTYGSKAITPPIRDHNQGRGWGEITFLEGMERSSNVLATLLGYEKLGKDKLYEYYNRFGMEEKTGIDNPYEKVGRLPSIKTAPPRDIAVTTFGQGFSATAIRQVTAIAAAINGGKLLQPHLVKEIRTAGTGEVVQSVSPTVLRQVISERSSKVVREVLESVVTSPHGTGRNYKVEGYRVGGKTGTAQKADAKGGYSEDKFIYSFVGFAPADRPELLVYVAIDEPQLDSTVRSAAVSQIFRDVMKNSLQYLQVAPEMIGQQQIVTDKEKFTAPDLIGQYSNLAAQSAITMGLQPVVIGTGDKILRQVPDAHTSIEEGARVFLITADGGVMPDFIGKSLREVVEFTTLMGIPVETHGSGYVVSQSIPEGTPILDDLTLTLRLEPKNPATVTSQALVQSPSPTTSQDTSQEKRVDEQPTEHQEQKTFDYSKMGSTD